MRRGMVTLLAVTIIAMIVASPGLASPPREGGGETLFLQLDLSEVKVAEGISPAQVLGEYRLQQGLQMKMVISLLVHLKDQGLVASFQPNFDANGILVTTTGAEGIAALRSSPGLFTTTAGSPRALERSAEAFHAAMRAPMKAATRKIVRANDTFWTTIDLGGNWLWGQVAPSTEVEVTLKAPEGNIIDRARAISDSDGWWDAQFRAWHRVYRGYTVIVEAGGITKSIRIRWWLTISAKRKTDVSSGKGPRNKTVWVGLGHLYLTDSGWDSDWYGDWVATDRRGNYSYDFTGEVNMKGDDYAFVEYWPNDNWGLQRGVTVPGVAARLQNNNAWGNFTPFTQITVILKDSRNREKARAVCLTDSGGYFRVEFYNENGNPVMVRPRDKITVSGSGSIQAKVMDLRAKANATEDTVSGKAKPNQRVAVGLRHWTSGTDYDYYQKFPEGDSTGHYLADFSSLVDMAVDDSGYVYASNPRTGDGTQVEFIAE